MENPKDKSSQQASRQSFSIIADLIKDSKRLFLLYVGVLAYCQLTILTTTDESLILNKVVTLPVLNFDVSLTVFFAFGPLLAIWSFIYFQLSFQRAHAIISQLEKGNSEIHIENLPQWLILLPRKGSEMIARIERGIGKFSLWWFLPLTLLLFAQGIIRVHKTIFFFTASLTLVLGTAIVVLFWYKYDINTRVSREKTHSFFSFLHFHNGRLLLSAGIIAFTMLLLFYIMPMAISGTGVYQNVLLSKLTTIDLSYRVLINKPATDFEGIHWGDFRQINLSGAWLVGSVLKRADLREAQFQNANLKRADLSGAFLKGADFKNARLNGSTFEYADLRDVKNLTINQLSTVKSLRNARLDSIKHQELIENYPHLLEQQNTQGHN